MYTEHNSMELCFYETASLTYIFSTLCLIAVFNKRFLFFFFRNMEVHENIWIWHFWEVFDPNNHKLPNFRLFKNMYWPSPYCPKYCSRHFVRLLSLMNLSFFYRNVEVHGVRGAGGKSNFVALEDLSNHSTAPNREQNRTSAW